MTNMYIIVYINSSMKHFNKNKILDHLCVYIWRKNIRMTNMYIIVHINGSRKHFNKNKILDHVYMGGEIKEWTICTLLSILMVKGNPLTKIKYWRVIKKPKKSYTEKANTIKKMPYSKKRQMPYSENEWMIEEMYLCTSSLIGFRPQMQKSKINASH